MIKANRLKSLYCYKFESLVVSRIQMLSYYMRFFKMHFIKKCYFLNIFGGEVDGDDEMSNKTILFFFEM